MQTQPAGVDLEGVAGFHRVQRREEPDGEVGGLQGERLGSGILWPPVPEPVWDGGTVGHVEAHIVLAGSGRDILFHHGDVLVGKERGQDRRDDDRSPNARLKAGGHGEFLHEW